MGTAKMLQHINHKVAQKMAEQLTKSKVAQKRKKVAHRRAPQRAK